MKALSNVKNGHPGTVYDAWWCMILTIKYANDSNIYSFDDEHWRNWNAHCANSHSGIKRKKKKKSRHEWTSTGHFQDREHQW